MSSRDAYRGGAARPEGGKGAYARGRPGSPTGGIPHSSSAYNVGSYYGEDLGSPTAVVGGPGEPPPPGVVRSSGGGGGHRSRSTTRYGDRERSLDRATGSRRERSLDRYGGYGGPPPDMDARPRPSARDGYVAELQARLADLQAQYAACKRELEATTQKLGSSMHSIKTFWSPELKKERALRKEEAAKYALINDQLKVLRAENQKQSQLIRQLEEELRLSHHRNPDAELQHHCETLIAEKEHMTKEIFLLRETIKELEMRIDTQKQTLASRDESIKKLMEMLQSKGIGNKLLEEERLEMERTKTKLIETESRSRHVESLLEARDKELGKLEEMRMEVSRRDQEILALSAKLKTLEEQHHDYQRHIAVLKESLCAKEEHYNMLQADVEELRQRLEEKNQMIEKKTQQSASATQDRARLSQEVQELRDNMDIKDRKINVLQRKIENLEDLLKEKDNQVDMARARLTAMQAHHSSSEGALSSLEEALGERDRQIAQLRDQRDRAERERDEERELHERDLADYKMKQHALESEMDKLQTDIKALQSKADVSPQLADLKKQLGDKQQLIEDLERKLKRRQDRMEKLEAQLQKSQAAGGSVAELQAKLSALEAEREASRKAVDKAREDAARAQADLERLLGIMTTMEEEKNNLNTQIKELQEALKEKEASSGTRSRRPSDRAGGGGRPQTTRTPEPSAGGETAREPGKPHDEADIDDESNRGKEEEVEGGGDVVEEEEEATCCDGHEARIAELEEAMREAVRITAQREALLAQREIAIRDLQEKVSQQNAGLRALESVQMACCANCPALRSQLREVQARLTKLVQVRKDQLEDLFSLKQEALQTALGEKDAHLALLELSPSSSAEIILRLKRERQALLDRIKLEQENRMKALLDLGDLPPTKTNGTLNEENSKENDRADSDKKS